MSTHFNRHCLANQKHMLGKFLHTFAIGFLAYSPVQTPQAEERSKLRSAQWFSWKNSNNEKNMSFAKIIVFCPKHRLGQNQGSSVRLVLPAILGEWRAWREIQNLYMRFVILKVRNPLLCTVSRGPLYVIARLPGSWDWPTWLNKPW